MLDPLAQLHRGIDHQRVEQQDQQRQLPVHPHQDPGGAHQGQHRHQETAEGFADEFVEGVQVSDQVGRHGATAQAFVLAQGNSLEPFDQADANAIDDVLGQAGEQARLQHIEQQCATAQGQGHQQHQPNVASRALPLRGQRLVHDFQGRIAMPQQHFIHQQR
ncbi:hypothetical protein D3C76_1371720 [compost metagenome]